MSHGASNDNEYGECGRVTTTTKATKDRSAHASIRGYCYQFDRTILEVLDADTDTEVLVEGLEDIDLLGASRSTAVQVKYWASKKYGTPRSIHEPVELMLKAYSLGANHDFILHVHFGQESYPPETLTIDELRACLTRKTTTDGVQIHLDYENYSEETLIGFTKRLRIRSGDDFETQNSSAKKHLARHLSASEQDVDDLHYAAALAHIQFLAMNPDVDNRKINRADFLARINNRQALYTRWHAETVGADRYAAGLARRLKQLKVLTPSKRKAVVISIDQDEVEAQTLACRLAVSEYGPGKMHTTKPWTLVIDGNDDQIRRVKLAVLKHGVGINDGYETIGFQTAAFDAPPVINRRGGGDVIKLASYSIRIISMASFREFIKEGHDFGVILAIEGLDDELCRAGSADPPIFYEGLSAEHIHKVIGGK